MDPGSRRKTQEKFVLLKGPFPSQTHTCVQYFDESRLSFLSHKKACGCVDSGPGQPSILIKVLCKHIYLTGAQSTQ